MSDDMETRIRERIAELTQQRDQLLVDANRQLAALSSAIRELEALLKEPEQSSPDEPSN
jgi:hypothetical protein